MQFSRSKRATSVPTGDIDTFRNNSQKYLEFIEQLTVALTQKNVKHGGIRVTKKDTNVTNAILKSGSTQVPFIYRNNDMYIIGFLVNNEFWVDGEEFNKLRLVNEKLPARHAWANVIGANTKVKSLSVPLSYNNILLGDKVKINRMGDSLRELSNVTNPNKRMNVVGEHLVPFVMAFSEAVRFSVVAQTVSKAFVKDGGVLDMGTKIMPLSGVGHPDARSRSAYDIRWLTLNWATLSDRAKTWYVDNKSSKPIKFRGEQLGLDKSQLNQLLAVASSGSFPDARRKRDTTYWVEHTVPLEGMDTSKRNLIAGGVNSGETPTSSQELLEPTRYLDLVGGLHLITLGILYLSGRKLSPLSFENHVEPYEAQAIAAELVQKINCVTDLDLGYERNMLMQKELAAQMARGGNVVHRMVQLIEEQFTNQEGGPDIIDAAKKAILFEFADKNTGDNGEYKAFERQCFLD